MFHVGAENIERYLLKCKEVGFIVDFTFSMDEVTGTLAVPRCLEGRIKDE